MLPSPVRRRAGSSRDEQVIRLFALLPNLPLSLVPGSADFLRSGGRRGVVVLCQLAPELSLLWRFCALDPRGPRASARVRHVRFRSPAQSPSARSFASGFLQTLLGKRPCLWLAVVLPGSPQGAFTHESTPCRAYTTGCTTDWLQRSRASPACEPAVGRTISGRTANHRRTSMTNRPTSHFVLPVMASVTLHRSGRRAPIGHDSRDVATAEQFKYRFRLV